MANVRGWRPSSRAAEFLKIAVWAKLAAVLAASGVATPATAQVGVGVSLQSDSRFRGRSLSDGKPVVGLDITYDHRSGLYLGGSAAAIVTTGPRAGLMSAQGYAGYSTRNARGRAFDIGIVGYHYTPNFSGNTKSIYAEMFAGTSFKDVSAYLRYAPRYFGRDASTLYADVGVSKRLSETWHVRAHLGYLQQIAGPNAFGGRRAKYDVRLGVAREIGRSEVEAAFVGAGPGGRYFAGDWQGRRAIIATFKRGF